MSCSAPGAMLDQWAWPGKAGNGGHASKATLVSFRPRHRGRAGGQSIIVTAGNMGALGRNER